MKEQKAYKLPGLNVIDLLYTTPSGIPFSRRVKRLQLGGPLEAKVLHCHEESVAVPYREIADNLLSREDEEELANEVLYYRHKFTRCLIKSREFRQAALTVIQNIYLFQNRHIFFTPEENPALERQQALELFSSPAAAQNLPLSKTLRHLVLARIWKRIIGNTDTDFFHDPALLELHSVVENLNCLRNIYVLFSTRLIRRLARRVNPLYKQSITYEDALQIGTFGVAKAAYRYHQSSGVRFSTYAADWVAREIQQQALSGRLIRISSNVVEQYAKAKKLNDAGLLAHYGPSLADASTILDDSRDSGHASAPTIPLHYPGPGNIVETRQQHELLVAVIDAKLSLRSANILKRRYGLPPFENNPQSAVEIAELYGLTRGRVYQLEQEAFKVIRKALLAETRAPLPL
ncbi:sigma-70 family RNA polymerase sigma factor [Desulfopila sp. IMCC35008]|uniref:sigma-70 family RNA polymerase sigma factor n=1 Tax=Desulfopila sp. IMCC35008 TaxID=2653858 RepID=UPI0013D3E214|nr:sigma-70 family RNA polymerase sigma factor [Desulfopila sp. IMCC35008]